LEDGRASAASVLFSDYSDAEPAAVHVQILSGAADYLPGEFYRRELPGILALLKKFDRIPDELIVDGYVMLGERPGLGYHLFSALGGHLPVIGVAKSKFKGASGIEVFRGWSIRPLYVTTAGMDPATAAERIQRMRANGYSFFPSRFVCSGSRLPGTKHTLKFISVFLNLDGRKVF
jgi:deoxyribonuclease V